MAEIFLLDGITLREAQRTAQAAGMYLITDGDDVKVSPMIPPGWWEVPIAAGPIAPDRGRVVGGRVAA